MNADNSEARAAVTTTTIAPGSIDPASAPIAPIAPSDGDRRYPNRIAVTAASVAAYVQDSIAIKQALLTDSAMLETIARVVVVCIDAVKAGGKILIAGNGGSAADAQHIAGELVARFEFERPGLPAIALTTDSSAMTAIGNDYGYDYVFARQLEALARPGDVFIGITTSGNSKNILRAMDVASRVGLVKIALCGQGGQVRAVADHVLAAPSHHTPRIQECHILIGHILCALLEENLFPEYKVPKPLPPAQP